MNIIKQILRKKGIFRLAFPPGHYASPIPDLDDSIKALKNAQKFEIIDINIKEKEQKALFCEIAPIINQIPFHEEKNDLKYRYYFNNSMFQRMDGSILYALIKYFKPVNYVEIGSGFSSGLILDVVEHENLNIQMTFIEPYPIRLKSILKKEDDKNVEIIENKIQDVDISIFKKLVTNDFLFLDTSHIVKTGGDVTFWLFNILPSLKSGVIIHIHDIFWPFEYSEEWIKEQKCYSEIYLIRAFLMNNSDYEIIFFNSYMEKKHHNLITEFTPELLKKKDSGSLWIRKL